MPSWCRVEWSPDSPITVAGGICDREMLWISINIYKDMHYFRNIESKFSLILKLS